ncbi:MAG: class I SAM-dependent methyltransferase [Bacteroidia bacterium]|nr:class I SAM-dependent methyltransferase [Bacteroidia bacterium]
MKKLLKKINAYFKGLVLLSKPHFLFGWMKGPLLFLSNTISLSKWIAQQDKNNILNDFYTAKRDYSKRYILYQYVIEKLNIRNEPFDFLEFGVCGGYSFKWWISNCLHPEIRFYGFDTFEGLPENWGTFKKGDMIADVPNVNDSRAKFIKGLFQESVPDFLLNHNLRNGKRKVIHMDADLFSSTLFALTTLGPYLKRGDVLFFDEFNVPNHEFYAYKIFCNSYYIKTKLMGAVNNYYQVALIIE